MFSFSKLNEISVVVPYFSPLRLEANLYLSSFKECDTAQSSSQYNNATDPFSPVFFFKQRKVN